MRILHVIKSVNPAGGGPIEGVKQLGRVLRELGHMTEVVSLDAPDEPWLDDCLIQVHPLGPALGTYGYSKRLIPWLRKHHSDYDALIINGLWQFGSFATRKALHGKGTPYFAYPHGMLDPWFKKTYPLKHLKKCFYWPWGEYRVLRDAHAVCFTCEEEKILARQSFRPYRCREVVVNYGTAAPEGDPVEQRQVFLSRFPELRDKKILLFLSRIHPKKGCDLLIDAFAKVASSDPSLHLVIAGPDQTGWKAQLELQAEELGIANRLTWPGMLKDDLKWGAYYAADAFVLPSHQENFGIVVAEALACGLPVLISNKVNIWREIETAKAGFVESDTSKGTFNLLQSWLKTPTEVQLQMQQNAIQCFTQKFEIHRAAQSLLELLKEN